jgi:hypothetical protein
MTLVFVVLETYYKHAEASVEILTGLSSIENYLLNELTNWGDSFDLEETYESEEDRVYALIEYAIEAGKRRLERQEGWGILSVTKLTVDNLNSIYTFN